MTPHEPWDGDSDLDALDFSPVAGDADSDLDGLPDYQPAPETQDDGWIDEYPPAEVPEDDDVQIPVVQVVNPPGTIAVTAHMNGAVAQVDLDPRVTRLTESQLEEEIRAIADVAAKRATAVVHVMVVEMLVGQGMDLAEARDFVETNMPFATPDQAEAAQHELSARYAQHADET
jgi:hypothetical protein